MTGRKTHGIEKTYEKINLENFFNYFLIRKENHHVVIAINRNPENFVKSNTELMPNPNHDKHFAFQSNWYPNTNLPK